VEVQRILSNLLFYFCHKGSIAGLAIIAEKRERRITLAQQVFVRSIFGIIVINRGLNMAFVSQLSFSFYRALQGAYNAGHAREYFNIPHGDSLLFMVTCGQVLYAYTVN